MVDIHDTDDEQKKPDALESCRLAVASFEKSRFW